MMHPLIEALKAEEDRCQERAKMLLAKPGVNAEVVMVHTILFAIADSFARVRQDLEESLPSD